MTGTMVLELIGIVIASNGLWSFLMEIYKNHKKKKTPMENMVLAIGRDRLMFLCKKYIKLGYIPEDEYESFIAMGEAYLNMHGNSKVKSLFERAKELPMEIEG